MHNFAEHPYPKEIRDMLQEHHEEFHGAINDLKSYRPEETYKIADKVPSVYYSEDINEARQAQNISHDEQGHPDLESGIVAKNAQEFRAFISYRTKSEHLDAFVQKARLTIDHSDDASSMNTSYHRSLLRPSFESRDSAPTLTGEPPLAGTHLLPSAALPLRKPSTRSVNTTGSNHTDRGAPHGRD